MTITTVDREASSHSERKCYVHHFLSILKVFTLNDKLQSKQGAVCFGGCGEKEVADWRLFSVLLVIQSIHPQRTEVLAIELGQTVPIEQMMSLAN